MINDLHNWNTILYVRCEGQSLIFPQIWYASMLCADRIDNFAQRSEPIL